MKKILLRIFLAIILLMLVIAILVFSYYKTAEIETKKPQEIEETCKIETKEYKQRKVFIITPKEAIENNLTILYFHGGSYVAEASDNHWDFIQNIVKDTGATVILPDYPLAPKYNYKDVFNMVEPLYNEIIKNINPENLVIMGDSAGGGISLALVEKLSQENITIPSKTILISPWLDVRLTNPKIDEIQKQDKKLNKETLKLAGIAYGGNDGINSYLVNPIEGDLSKIKNVTILTGTNDILNPDVHLLQEKAKKINVAIDVKEYKNARTYMDNRQR